MYKVLRRLNNGMLVSAVQHCGVLPYVENGVNTPSIPNSKLFVFGELFDALDFLNKEKNCYNYRDKEHTLELWKIKGINPQECFKIDRKWDDFKKFWENYTYKKNESSICLAPTGTLLCDSIELVKLLKVCIGPWTYDFGDKNV